LNNNCRLLKRNKPGRAQVSPVKDDASSTYYSAFRLTEMESSIERNIYRELSKKVQTQDIRRVYEISILKEKDMKEGKLIK
jgi:hypothetical protein